MRRFLADVLDPKSRYELEPIEPRDLVRALEIDTKFASLRIALVDGIVPRSRRGEVCTRSSRSIEEG